jgi:hypothetical protein
MEYFYIEEMCAMQEKAWYFRCEKNNTVTGMFLGV